MGDLYEGKCRPAKSGADNAPTIVFVHGLSGSPQKTWKSMLKYFCEDQDFDNHNIDCFEFPTKILQLPFLAKPPGLRSMAEGLKTFLEEKHGKSDSVLVIAHSLGGLIVRQLVISRIRDNRPCGLDRLALIAVPINGSMLANVCSKVSRWNPQLKELGKDVEALMEQNLAWAQLKVEDNLSVKYLLGGIDRVVPHMEMFPLIDSEKRAVLINSDHRSIVVPDSKDDLRFLSLKSFLLDHDSDSNERTCLPTPNNTEKQPDPLFEVYTARDEPYYINRQIDVHISQILGSGHVWLTGDSGMGKTAAIRRALCQNGCLINQISLASHESSTAKSLFRAMSNELASAAGVTDLLPIDADLYTCFEYLRRVLRSFPKDISIANVIEEMPLEIDELCEFADTIAKLIEFLVGDGHLHERVQFALSSRLDLALNHPGISAKTRESIQILSIDDWSRNDIGKLVQMLTGIIKPALSNEEQELIIDKSGGSPRFVKNLYRKWRNGIGENKDLETLLTEVCEEQVR
mgnify:CR=1 FL=1|tara:strand:- start:3278 stop:4828 length:1551 start_codon:yes stop_codon:yes gene_type:complete